MNTSALPTPLADVEAHDDLLMLELKPHLILDDAGMAHIIRVVGQMPGNDPFNVLLKVMGDMDRSLELWKDRLLASRPGARVKAVVVVTESPLFGVRTQTYLGKCRASLSHPVARAEEVCAAP